MSSARWPRPGPARPSLGFYLHVPFCVARCHYCSFNTAPLDRAALLALSPRPGPRDRSARRRAVGGRRPPRQHLLRGRDALAPRPRRTGAPSSTACARASPSRRTPRSPWSAIPRASRREALAAYRQAGVTRVSLGVQSLDDALLAAPGAPALGARRPAGLRGHARRRLRQRERRSHVRAARPRRGGLDADGGGRSRLGAGAPLRLRAHPRRGQPVGRRRRGRTAGRGRRWWPSTGPWRARRRRGATSTTRSPTTRDPDVARATTSCTGAPPSTSPPARGAAASSVTCATPTPSP